ncbi:DUF2157 domain-containing protein [Mucilaginibacter sp.]|jgi:hypothetical protein|uniref:DUF2157 domain-containing protein n=1 Tax=Mucilaginibacter sp. TaxID=1882438 RepID=UPI002C123526|nr:DUF2157 domain-containing protein [Mucilaginibacter sp.]HTI60429.1 DUF2157 domain-containing protein [Mucilaginibacter sp.]
MPDIYEELHSAGLLSDESFAKVNAERPASLFSVHWEIKSFLYLGVLLLTGGLGLLIYENIDTIGHQFVLILIALICVGCFAYCFKTKLPFSTGQVRSPNTAFDYILLLGCTSFLIFVGYLQFEYKVFGLNYGLATLIPMLVLFFTAYYFDHLGILNLAIANLALWMGVSVTPKQLLLNSDFNSETIIYTYLLLGILLMAGAYNTQRYNFKKHFKFSYQHYGVHVSFITLLAGYFHYYNSFACSAWVLALFFFAYLVYKDAFKHRSFYFILLVVLYSYIAVSSLVVRVLIQTADLGAMSLLSLYFIGSGIGLIFLLININKQIKAK